MTLDKTTRRVVTGHDAEGRAIFRSDDIFPLEPIPIGGADFALIWTTPTVPVDNNDEVDGRERPADLTLRGGSVLRVGDLLPGSVSSMHRSNSIDYGIVMSGQIELELDNGETKLLGPGDIVVQRGTIHLWRNPSETETCRMIWILIEAAPYMQDGVPMEEVHP
jgi:quercetin dioxygenase-like cupin family protein